MKGCGAGAHSLQETAHRRSLQPGMVPCPPFLHKLPQTPVCKYHTLTYARNQARASSPYQSCFCSFLLIATALVS